MGPARLPGRGRGAVVPHAAGLYTPPMLPRFRAALLALVLGATCCAPAAFAAAKAAPKAEVVTVILKRAAVRRDRQFYAPAVAEAAYGEKLAVLGREKDWVKVSAGTVTGWVHKSAVTAGKVKTEEKLNAPVPEGFQEGEDEDVALAAKGFNPQVESEYRKKNPGANYAGVDRMEKLGTSEKAVGEFVRDGNLVPRGGAK